MSNLEELKKDLDEILEELKTLPLSSRAYRRLDEERAEIEAQLSGAIAQGENSKAVGEKGVMVGGAVGGDVVTGVKIVLGLEKKSLPHPEALARYLENMIVSRQWLRLQGIRAGDQPLSVLLEKVYISLMAVDKQVGNASKRDKPEGDFMRDSGVLSIGAAMKRYPRLVIIGDPGSGKTTLLGYLALTYARTLGTADNLVKSRLGLDEAASLPILLALRDLGHCLNVDHPDGPALLLDYLRDLYAAQEIDLPDDFFSIYLESGRAVVLLDGMDEVADADLRQRVARLIEKFANRYEKARFVVTSREVGYHGAARIAAGFGLAKVRDFTNEEVCHFFQDWTRVVETVLAGSETPDILRMAQQQADKLIQIIERNPRVAELAVNPLLLTVIALVHRYRAQLSERRSELYEEAVEVLLWHWDKAKGLEDEQTVAGLRLDSGDRRSLLEPVAFWMHERQRREIELADLRDLLLPRFVAMTGGDPARAAKAVDVFLHVINERSGLLIERSVGVFGFAHLTFQEYLAARALTGREDMLEFTLKVLPNSWWREVILLQVGYLSNQGPSRVSKLIAAILDADPKTEPEPHHHLLLAAECLFNVGPARVEGNLLGEARKRLQTQADAPILTGNRQSVLNKVIAMNALARIESGQFQSQYWTRPWGEPEWVTIPSGEFWMGNDQSPYNDERPAHKLFLSEYQIARVPVTNAQYALYVKDSDAQPPSHWRGGDIPKGLENHPVTNVTWGDTLAYCQWLSEKTGKNITLPSEAEWEKAARGPLLSGETPIRGKAGGGMMAYPWGSKWKEFCCNSAELGLNETTPVDLFLNGASPYGVLDMSGNVWEWTRSLYGKYPYPSSVQERAERENANTSGYRALRGGSWDGFPHNGACVSDRYYSLQCYRDGFVGFRLAISAFPG